MKLAIGRFYTFSGLAVTILESYGDGWIGILEKYKGDLLADPYMVWNDLGEVSKYGCTTEVHRELKIVSREQGLPTVDESSIAFL